MSVEIYKPPASDLQDSQTTKDAKFPKKLRGSVLAILTVWFYFGLNKIVPQFADTFSSFGADLPALTILSIKISVAFVWFGFLSIAILIFWLMCITFSAYENVAYKIIKYLFYLSISILTIILISMYLPIFQLGTVV